MLKFYVLQEPTVRLALSKFGSNVFFLSLPHMLLGFEVFFTARARKHSSRI